jgi:diguanylate cyclase (GGDEF)-like protein/PAS domain S-box-containing protein
MNTQGLLPAPDPANAHSISHPIPRALLLRKSLLLAIPLIALFGIAVLSYYAQHAASVEENARRLNLYANRDFYLTLQQVLRNIKGDARLLVSNPLLPRVLSNPWGSDAQLLGQQWTAFSAQKRIYDQLRLLDIDGKEILRINLTPTGAVAIPREQLQNKAKRYYFREAMTLPPGEIYLSPLDLNIENGMIEQPIKPMLRIGIPVTDTDGGKLGLLILNYLAANIMHEIDAHNVLTDSHNLLLNQQGYYLHGVASDREWLFMYPEHDQNVGRFSTDYPDVWRHINRVGQDQLVTPQGIFAYRWLSTNETPASPAAFSRRFIMISMLSTEQLAAMKAPYRQAASAASLLGLPAILVFAFILSHFRLRELRAFERLHQIELNQRQILESVGEGILGIDTDGRLTFANSRAETLTGYPQSEMLGRPLHSLIHACNDSRSQHLADACPLQQSLVHGKARREENDIFIRKNCETFPVEYISNPIFKDGVLHGGVVSFFDITARKKAEQHIEYLVLYDPLTDLPNKRLFLDRLAQQLAAARTNDQTSALLYIDIDRFKQINDAMGHVCGDEILAEVARRLKYTTQEGDTIAHIGSDEFVLLRANDSSGSEEMAHGAQLTADEIMLILEQPFYIEHESIRLTVSVGIAIFPLDDEDASTILAQADTAVSSAKRAGRRTTRFFKSEMEHSTKAWLLIHNRMLEAIAHDAFTLVYQPKVKEDGGLIGIEALLRWTDGDLGVVSPADFIPIAEQSGLIVQINDFVLSRTCGQIRRWRDAGLLDALGRVAINISPTQFNNRNFVDYILGHMEQAGIEPGTVELELTERTLADDTAAIRGKLLTLREHGMHFSIDDFGTGYSSLAYLQQLPLDWLKIDRAFITDVDKNSDRRSIVEAIILLARGLEMDVIAEGVETEAELRYLLAAGCHEFQGYHFYRPMSPESVTALLRERISAPQTPPPPKTERGFTTSAQTNADHPMP